MCLIGDTVKANSVFNPTSICGEIDEHVDLTLKSDLMPHDRLAEVPIKYVLSNISLNVV